MSSCAWPFHLSGHRWDTVTMSFRLVFHNFLYIPILISPKGRKQLSGLRVNCAVPRWNPNLQICSWACKPAYINLKINEETEAHRPEVT